VLPSWTTTYVPKWIALTRSGLIGMSRPISSGTLTWRDICLWSHHETRVWLSTHANIKHRIVLTDTDHHVTMLAEAFKNLPNLQAVGMRDFSSYTRHRDYPSNQWQSTHNKPRNISRCTSLTGIFFRLWLFYIYAEHRYFNSPRTGSRRYEHVCESCLSKYYSCFGHCKC